MEKWRPVDLKKQTKTDLEPHSFFKIYSAIFSAYYVQDIMLVL